MVDRPIEKLSFIFWQNCVSPHQTPYIKELCKDPRTREVLLIVPLLQIESRINLGWEKVYNIPGIKLIVSPNEKHIRELFFEYQENSIHLFSGIRADAFIYNCFRISLNYSLKRGVITEGPYVYNKPLLFHKIRFMLFDYAYLKNIDYIFAIGDLAISYYKGWRSNCKVVPFGYCAETVDHIINVTERQCVSLVYVGSLIKRKNVILLLRAINKLKISDEFTLDIIGSGPELKLLKKYVHKNLLNNKVMFKGSMSIEDTHRILSDYDILILPSKHDGWGAVTNEALHKGLYVILSSSCGSKCLVENSDRGIVFDNNDLDSLKVSLKKAIDNVDLLRSNRRQIIEWSTVISGRAFSEYMINCFFDKNVNPPWL